MYKRWFWKHGRQLSNGVCFTRDPKTGLKTFGEWLPRAQGEDVVAGTHTPRPLNTQSISENQDQMEMNRHWNTVCPKYIATL